MANRVSKGSRAQNNAAAVVRDGETPIVALRDDDLITVTGGVFMSNVASTLKTLGDGISTMARKG